MYATTIYNPLQTNPPNTNPVDHSRTNLIINYLPQTMTSEELKSIFQSIGRIESCRLIKDKESQQSLCYGFINYFNEADAKNAVKTFNGLSIQNKVIKVSFARPSSESIKGANLYVCGFPKTWTCDDLNTYLGACGKIITSRILYNCVNGQSKGVGFVRFDQKHEAELAINKMNMTVPEGCKDAVTLKFANYPAEIKSSSWPSKYHVNVPENMFLGRERLVSMIESIKSTNNSPFQFSLDGMDPFCHGDNLLHPVMPTSHRTIQPSNDSTSNTFLATVNNATGWCLFVYNLSPNTQESTLWELFGPFGAVFNVKVVRDFETQSCRGFGFVTMFSYEDATRAISSLNGISVAGRVLQVSFKTSLKL